jgi:hypothetical protein
MFEEVLSVRVTLYRLSTTLITTMGQHWIMDGSLLDIGCFVVSLAASVVISNLLNRYYRYRTSVPDQNLPLSTHMRKTEDSINLSDLAVLASSHKLFIKESSRNILFNRAISPDYLPFIIAACKDHTNPLLQKQAVSCVGQLAIKDKNKPILSNARVPRILVKILHGPADNVLHKLALIAVYNLVENNGNAI